MDTAPGGIGPPHTDSKSVPTVTVCSRLFPFIPRNAAVSRGFQARVGTRRYEAGNVSCRAMVAKWWQRHYAGVIFRAPENDVEALTLALRPA